MEYLSNHWSDLPQILNLILNLRLFDQSKLKTIKVLQMKTTSNKTFYFGIFIAEVFKVTGDNDIEEYET